MTQRQLKIKGDKLSSVVTADITVNGMVVFSGELATGENPIATSETLSAPGDLVNVSYAGADDQEVIAVEIKITSGVAMIGPFFSDVTELPANNLTWRNMTRDDRDLGDGRSEIKVNGVDPIWPSNSDFILPGGTPENPAWTGYSFEISADSIFSCNYKSPSRFINFANV